MNCCFTKKSPRNRSKEEEPTICQKIREFSLKPIKSKDDEDDSLRMKSKQLTLHSAIDEKPSTPMLAKDPSRHSTIQDRSKLVLNRPSP